MMRRLTSHSIERAGTRFAVDARRRGKPRGMLRETQWAT
jgi:hypothetical protein